jgi:hypothetical protein
MCPNDGEDPSTFFARMVELQAKHGNGNGAGTPLAIAAKMWSTPRASLNENRTTRHAPTHGNGHGRTLAGDAGEWSGRQGATTPRAGARTSRVTLDLSPFFVEAVMGWPIGWTDCASWETESSLTKQPSPFTSLPNVSASEEAA